METLLGTGIALILLFLVLGRVYGLSGTDDPGDTAPKKKRRGPDMAFSAGRDPAHQNTRMQQVFIPMEPHEEPALRDFYLGTLGLLEMRSPNHPPEADGFWIASGTRQIYLGTHPGFSFDPRMLPAFPMKRLDDVAQTLDAAGHAITWDRRKAFVTRLIVVDPAGTEIALIAG